MPTVRVAHEELMHRPWPTMRRMLEHLSKAGVPISRNTTRIHRRAEEWLPAGSKSEKEEGLITSMLNAAIAKQLIHDTYVPKRRSRPPALATSSCCSQLQARRCCRR